MDRATQVNSSIAKAAKMMSGSYMDYLDNISAIKFGGGNKKRRNGSSNDLRLLEQQAFGYSSGDSSTSYAPQQMPVIQEQPQQKQFNSSILNEAFSQTPPLSGDNFPGSNAYNFQPGAALLNEQRVQQQPYVQQPMQVYQAQQPITIDYNMIKYLVSEAVKESVNEIKQSILSESTLRGINMPGGNKIQFLDSKGNVYEGQLVLKKKKA